MQRSKDFFTGSIGRSMREDWLRRRICESPLVIAVILEAIDGEGMRLK